MPGESDGLLEAPGPCRILRDLPGAGAASDHQQVEVVDLPSRERWFQYSKARDRMLKATDAKHAPWFVLRSDDKKRARLNAISHILAQVPYKRQQAPKVRLPDRSAKGTYDDQKSLKRFNFVKERY